MDIRDLSVGDWVLNVYGTPAQILAIENWSDGHVLNVRIKDIGIGEVPITRVSPIPISQEILEKNGFKKNGEYDEWNIGTWETPDLIGVSLERPSIIVKHKGTSIFLDQAKYTHQLQHALRLAKSRKEITL